MTSPLRGTFRSLDIFNYRVWATGAIVSNVGTWMQRTAQDWLVLAELTHRNATAVGVVMALQFGPQLLFLPVSGLAADRLDRRKLLLATQSSMGVLALLLGILTVTGFVRLWHVFGFAFLLGTVSAFDAPARQTFVFDLVGEVDLSNAVALNAASFNMARMIGPAIAGLLITAVGTGWVFLINAASFVAVIASLMMLRRGELTPTIATRSTHNGFIAGFRYVRAHPDLFAILLMFFFIGTFGLNFPIFISTMAVSVFHTGARGFGLLSSIMAIGSVGGRARCRNAQAAEHHRSVRGFRRLRLRISICGARPQLLALRPRAHRGGGVGANIHEQRQWARATLDGAHDARARDRHSARAGDGYHANRRTDCRMGRR